MESVMVMVTVAEVMSGGSVKKGKSVHPKTNPDWLMVKTWMSSSQIKHALSLSLSNKPGSYEQLFIFFCEKCWGSHQISDQFWYSIHKKHHQRLPLSTNTAHDPYVHNLVIFSTKSQALGLSPMLWGFFFASEFNFSSDSLLTFPSDLLFDLLTIRTVSSEAPDVLHTVQHP